MITSRVMVTARDTRGRPLVLPRLRATYEQATGAEPLAPSLFLEPTSPGPAVGRAMASVRVSLGRNPSAFAALLRGLLEISRKHRHVELTVEAPGAGGSPFAHGVGIYRGGFDRRGEAITAWLDGFEARAAEGAAADFPAPAPGAERIGDLGPLHRLLSGSSWALSYAGVLYLRDGPETARRISPPGRFSPAAWSADGTVLAAIGRTEGGELSVWLSRDRSGLRALALPPEVGDPSGCAFPAGGDRIAVSTGKGRLVVSSLEGELLSDTTVAPGSRLVDPTWSRDGEAVACISEDASRARTLHLVGIGQHRPPPRLLGVDSPASEDVAMADPDFTEDGTALVVRALWGVKGEARRPRLIHCPVPGGGHPAPVGPPLSRVRPPGGVSRWRNGRLFLAGVGEHPAGGKPSADAVWLEAATLLPAVTGETVVVKAPRGARLAFGLPSGEVVFVRRTNRATRLWRGKERVRLPFPAWVSIA